jgi:hypothetical protein
MKPDKISLSLSLVIILAAVSWITSCTHDADISDLPEICINDVSAIYFGSCSDPSLGRCHDGTGESDLVFLTPDDIRNSVVAGNPDASRSYQAIITKWGENKMPPSGALSQENRTIIRVWIEQGAKDNSTDQLVCPVAVPAGGNNNKDFLNNY